MNHVRCEVVLDGPGPNESIVKVQRIDGSWEEVIAPKRSIEHGFLLARRVASSEGNVLVELPQESASGNWRVWVPEASMK
jgi:hypothetical protein